MTVLHMNILRNDEALQLHRSLSEFSAAPFSVVLLTAADVGINFDGQAHRNMFDLTAAMNTAGNVPDARMGGFSGKRILCAQFNVEAYRAVMKSLEPSRHHIYQYTPDNALDRALIHWVSQKNQQPELRNQPIRFSPVDEETFTRDIIFPDLALLLEFETVRRTGFFEHEAERMVQMETRSAVLKPGQR